MTVHCARTYAIAELVISMMLFQSLISPWIHGGDPVNALHINKLLLKFKVSTILLFLHTLWKWEVQQIYLNYAVELMIIIMWVEY